MRHFRLDSKTAAAVNRGLAVALLSDVPSGIKVMRNAGVPLAVARRVFLSPNKRRASDWKHE